MRKMTSISVGLLSMAIWTGTALAQDPAPVENPAATRNAPVAAPTAPTTPSGEHRADDPAAPPPAVGVPKIVVEEPLHDFGEIWMKETLSHTFIIRNAGDTTLKIDNVKPGCGCTVSGPFDREIPPGGTGKVPLTLRTKGLNNFTKAASIYSNDPNSPMTQVTLKGTIKYYVKADPNYIRFLKLKPNETAEQTIKLTTVGEDAKLVLANDGVAGKFQATISPGDKANEYNLFVKGTPPFDEGKDIREKLVIQTGVPEQPTLELDLYARVDKRIEIVPDQLVVPKTGPEGARQKVVLNNNGTTPVKVKSASVEGGEITASVREITEGSRYEVEVAFPAEYEPPTTGQKLTLTLEDSGEKQEIVYINPTRNAHLPKSPPPQRPQMTMLGQPAPKAKLEVHEGQPYDLGGGEDVVVLTFYATWCPHCKKALPRVEQVYQQYKDNPKVHVIAVSEDSPNAPGARAKTPEQVVATYRELGLTHPLVMDSSQAVGSMYKANSFPSIYVVGPSGKVEAVHVGNAANLESALKQQIDTLLSGKSLLDATAAAPTAKLPTQAQPVPVSAPKVEMIQRSGAGTGSASVGSAGGSGQ